MHTQLLCTFTTKFNLDETIEDIKGSYDIAFNKIYVFQNNDNIKEFICTYNINLENPVDYNVVANTISLHRKKYSNTLYTINALNEVIANLNNGVVDSKFIVPWENFKNTLLVTNSDGLNRISTKLYKIIKID